MNQKELQSDRKYRVCPGCELLCDDIPLLNLDTDSPANLCSKGRSYFDLPIRDIRSYVRGDRIDQMSAIEAAAEILRNSQSPVIAGLNFLATEAQQSAWKLGKKLGSTIDSGLLNRGRSHLFSLCRVGSVGATLGEIANRADLVVYWFFDPADSHPRLVERLGDRSRHVVVVDEVETSLAKEADTFFQIKRERGADLLSLSRMSLQKIDFDPAEVGQRIGISPLEFSHWMDWLQGASYGAWLTTNAAKHSEFDLAGDLSAQLIRELNDHTRFVGLSLRTDQNGLSAENVLAWSSGFATPTSLRGSNDPRSHWLEYSFESQLNSEECDSVLLITGSDCSWLDQISPIGRRHFESIPKIHLSPSLADPSWESTVRLEVGLPGIQEMGEFCRSDDISLPVGTSLRNDGNFGSAKKIIDSIQKLL